MRFSTLKDNPNYVHGVGALPLRIFCNGEYIKSAHTVDTQEGYVKYYERNDQGRIKTKEIWGKVEVLGELIYVLGHDPIRQLLRRRDKEALKWAELRLCTAQQQKIELREQRDQLLQKLKLRGKTDENFSR